MSSDRIFIAAANSGFLMLKWRPLVPPDWIKPLDLPSTVILDRTLFFCFEQIICPLRFVLPIFLVKLDSQRIIRLNDASALMRTLLKIFSLPVKLLVVFKKDFSNDIANER